MIKTDDNEDKDRHESYYFLSKLLQLAHELPIDTHLQCGIFLNKL